MRLDRAHTSSRPVPVSALQVSTGVDHPSSAGRAGAARRPARGPPGGPRPRAVPSALLTAMTSASSSTPFLMPCSSSPVRASVSSRKVSTMSATAVSDWPDADRLDEHDVVAGRLHDDDRLAGRAGDAAERAGRRRRADERVRVGGEPGHPGLVAEDAAAGAGRRRVDGEHRDPVALRRSAAPPSASMNVDLPTPGTPVMPTRRAGPACGSSRGQQRPARARGGRRGSTRPA